MKIRNYSIVLLVAIFVMSCTKKDNENTLFKRVNAEFSGINFENKIPENDVINILNYEYLYNGGGVGIGDFNNDGLPDIIFSGNIEKSSIYINKGNFKFEDITKKSGINTTGKWCTGINVIDINQDGFDDIYINVGGMGNKSMFPNLLYINNGDLTFTESAKAYGLADQGESIQSVFFDYDLDGDLDMYLLTGGGFEKSAITVRHIFKNGESRNTDRLYRNDFNKQLGHPVYTNVSSDAGITIEGFGLGVSVFDANNDNWPDLYISNDYLSRDLLYINQRNGTFKEEALNYFGHTSHFSMGNDVADINNDGFLDVLSVDMLPENVQRRKLMSGNLSPEISEIATQFGYGNQYMRNMLQLNTGNSTFSEIGQLSGIEKTDWSWAPLMADFDNDGFNDIYITNGFGKDITDMDFVKFREDKAATSKNFQELKKSVIDCLSTRPAIKKANYAYKNNGNLTFSKVTSKWGFNEESISNGAAYADFDLDGDLDIVVNNINQKAFLYKNTLREKDSVNTNYLKVKLVGSNQNKIGIGAKVTLYSGTSKMVRYLNTIKGFQSSVDRILHFGLNTKNVIDSLKVEWPDGKLTKLQNVKVNQQIKISYINAKGINSNKIVNHQNQFFKSDSLFNFIHKDKFFNDFGIQSLLLNKHSGLGPSMATGDLNGDGLTDIFIGASYGFNSVILYQNKKGLFDEKQLPNTELYEDGGALIFDANGDGFSDLYVTSGGSERYAGHKAYQDRIYYNIAGKLTLGELPEMLTSTFAITSGDYDNDGDIDLFIGGRLVPGSYPMPPKSYILRNDSGIFKNVTDSVCPYLNDVGMITSAVWTDFNNDSFLDLVLVGEFMPITFLKGSGKQLKNITQQTGVGNSSGLWNSIQLGDFDNDGDMDFVAGNLGLNSNLKIVNGNPIKLHYADFDKNGSIDPVFSKYESGHYYPLASLDVLVTQLPIIKKKFLYYNNFAKSTTSDILKMFNVTDYKTLYAQELKTSYIENLGNNIFKLSTLPIEVQVAPINGILSEDINQDGFLDLLMVGNNFSTEVTYGKYDASMGHALLNQGRGAFKTLPNSNSGFSIGGDAKSVVKVNLPKKSLVLVGKNNSAVKILQQHRTTKAILMPNFNEVYAHIEFENGTFRKHEFTLGGGYLSQTSNAIEVSTLIKTITFYNCLGTITRKIKYN